MDHKIKKLRHALKAVRQLAEAGLDERDPLKLAEAADCFKHFEDAFREMARHCLMEKAQVRQ